jgi:hypothetical protein
MRTKTCTKCYEAKELDMFFKSKKGKYGLNSVCKSCVKKYYRENKEKINKWRRCYRKNKFENDVEYKLTHLLRRRVYMAIKKQYGAKALKTMELLSCDIVKCKKHVESLFKLGMTWNNYGKWHIDHIIPCSSFDLTEPEQQKKCFHYTNLQPLWAEDNLKKGKKINNDNKENSRSV